MTKQCLERRLDSLEKVRAELSKWEKFRNDNLKEVSWQFFTKDARVKLKSLYPALDTQNQ